jgi:TolA-binding protein
LYNSKANAESKASIIKIDKNSDGSIANQFKQKVTELTAKIEEAEKDIDQLEAKIEKMTIELQEIKGKN